MRKIIVIKITEAQRDCFGALNLSRTPIKRYSQIRRKYCEGNEVPNEPNPSVN